VIAGGARAADARVPADLVDRPDTDLAGIDLEMVGPVVGFVAELEHPCLYKHARTGRNAAQSFFAMMDSVMTLREAVRCGKSRPVVESGGSQAAGYVDRILRGEKPTSP